MLRILLVLKSLIFRLFCLCLLFFLFHFTMILHATFICVPYFITFSFIFPWVPPLCASRLFTFLSAREANFCWLFMKNQRKDSHHARLIKLALSSTRINRVFHIFIMKRRTGETRKSFFSFLPQQNSDERSFTQSRTGLFSCGFVSEQQSVLFSFSRLFPRLRLSFGSSFRLSIFGFMLRA